MYKATAGVILPTSIIGSLPRPSWYTAGLGSQCFLEAMHRFAHSISGKTLRQESRGDCGRSSFKTIFFNGILQHGMHDNSDVPLKIRRPLKRHVIHLRILDWNCDRPGRLPIDFRRRRYSSPACAQSPQWNPWRR